MNKMMVIIAVLITGVLINDGLAVHTRIMDIIKQKEEMMLQNISMSDEIKQKQTFRKIRPVAISKVFTMFVNQARMFEGYGGTQIKIVFPGSTENENIEEHYVETDFRHVKALPLTINVQKFSDETDMTEVLNDIYLLECCTDFKISEISTENNALIVKGELYGI